MKLSNIITTVDSHSAGEPLRTITGGIPYLKGNTMYDKMIDMEKNYDHVRKMVMMEPRGHSDMLGAVLTPPVNQDSDVGVFYIDTRGYAPMCGAGTLALCKTLVDTGMVPVDKNDRKKDIYMDTPAGTVVATAVCKDGIAEKVKFKNIDSFLYEKKLPLKVDGYDEFLVDITYGGNFFVMVDADNFDIEFHRKNAKEFAKLGMMILEAANKQFNICHPERKEITFLNDIMFCKDPDDENQNYRNLVIFGMGTIDRSPCGTGTCARMAKLYAEGKLRLNEEFIHESIIGTKFTGRVLSESSVGPYESIIPELEGECAVTGFNKFVLDEKDDLGYGFMF